MLVGTASFVPVPTGGWKRVAAIAEAAGLRWGADQRRKPTRICTPCYDSCLACNLCCGGQALELAFSQVGCPGCKVIT